MDTPLEAKLRQLNALMLTLDLPETLRLIGLIEAIHVKAVERAAMLSGERKPPGHA